MKNKDYIDYIINSVKKKIRNAKLTDFKHKHQPNDNFYVMFDLSSTKFGLSKDRGYIEGFVIKNEQYKNLSHLNPSIANLKLNINSIDVIVNYLQEHRTELFPE